MKSGKVCTKDTRQFNPSIDLSFQDVTIASIANPQIIRITLKASKTDPSEKKWTSTYREALTIYAQLQHS